MATAAAISYTMLPGGPIKVALTTVIVVALTIAVTKPSLFYHNVPMVLDPPPTEPVVCPEGCYPPPAVDPPPLTFRKIREFGTGPGDTVFPIWMILFVSGFAVYVMSMATEIQKLQS